MATNNSSNQDNNNQGGRGFAGMDSDRQREISAEGGRASHENGNAHKFPSQEAREAGSKSHSGGGQGSNQGAQNRGDGQTQSGGSGGQGGGRSQGGGNQGGGPRGGSSEQRAEAGRQSHKTDR